jgi:hypothetical protein
MNMKYVVLPFDATQYLAKLPELAGELPPGAREFATDPHHYDFGSAYSVKDLKLSGIDYSDQAESIDLVLRFAHSPFSHAAPLEIRYADVLTFSVEVGEKQPEIVRLGTLALDEILPHEHGCSHEIGFHAGSVSVVCRDLVAAWQPSE